MSVMMSLGGLKFKVAQNAYDTLERVHSWRWAKRELHGALPSLEYKGKGAGEIKLNGVIIVSAASDVEHVSDVVALGNEGKPQRLISGSNALGSNWGMWVLESVTESQSEFISDGTPQVIAWDIKLVEYGANSQNQTG